MSKGLLAAIVVILILIAGAAGYLYGVDSVASRTTAYVSTTILTTTTANATLPLSYTQVSDAFANQLLNFESRNASPLTKEYEGNATLTWGGLAARFGGEYIGPTNIALLYKSLLSNATSLALTITTFKVQVTGNRAFANSTFGLSGYSKSVCNINGTAMAEVSYVHAGGAWLISNETWIFNPSMVETGGPSVFSLCR
jgi:hypothetical protein